MELSSSSCRSRAGKLLEARLEETNAKLLTVLMALLARVARQAASAIGFNPASTRAAAQETTVGANAAMHSKAMVSDVR
jgi:hypothetical protein